MIRKARIANTLTLLLLIILVISMTGCGGKTEDGKVLDKGQPESNKNEAAVVSANQLVAKGKAVDGYSYDYILTMPDGKKITHKMWLKAGNMRSEMSNPVTGEPMLSIVNLTDKAVFLYQPELKQATKMSIDQSEVDTTSPGDYLEKVDPAGMMFMKREHFDGKECLVYEMNTSGMSGKMWIWEDHGMPLRVESQAGQDKVVVEFLNFKIGDIDDSLFKLPAGTEIVDLGAMLKQ